MASFVIGGESITPPPVDGHRPLNVDEITKPGDIICRLGDGETAAIVSTHSYNNFKMEEFYPTILAGGYWVYRPVRKPSVHAQPLPLP